MTSQDVHILGAGAVVQGMLASQKMPMIKRKIRVYDRTQTNMQNISGGAILFLCASTNEETILRNSEAPTRFSVATENLKIVDDLLKRGFFSKGVVFVLTNPSELIAEYVYRTSGNEQVFALGLSNDRKRYADILRQPRFKGQPSGRLISIGGNHYEEPYPQFSQLDSTIDERIWVSDLQTALRIKVISEFQGFRPPIQSGVTLLNEVLGTLQIGGSLEVSGFCKRANCFTGGTINFEDFQFHPTQARTQIAQEAISAAAERHRRNYDQVLKHISTGATES